MRIRSAQQALESVLLSPIGIPKRPVQGRQRFSKTVFVLMDSFGKA